MKISNILYASAVIGCLSAPAFSEELPNYKEETLTGDWNGTRESLAKSGIDIEAIYKFDVMGNASGGIREGVRSLDNLDVIFAIDGEKLFNSPGTSALIQLTNNNGDAPDTDLVGSAQGIDNVEVTDPALKLSQAWLQQNFFDNKISLLGGLYDTNSEFYVTPVTDLFLHSTYGMGTEFAQTGINGPSTFPETSAGLRLKIEPRKEFYLQAAVLDGVPGKPNHPHGVHVDFDNNDGALLLSEIGYVPGGETPKGKIGVGAWYYTEESDDLVAVDSNGNPLRKNNKGMYLIGEHQLYEEPGEKDQGLAGFIRIGFADENINQFDYAWATGLVYTGLIPARDEGQFGFGINGAHNSDKFKQSSFNAGDAVDSAEIALELTYSDNITKWFSVQPDVQYVINPGTNKALDNALVIGSRFTVKF